MNVESNKSGGIIEICVCFYIKYLNSSIWVICDKIHFILKSKMFIDENSCHTWILQAKVECGAYFSVIKNS